MPAYSGHGWRTPDCVPVLFAQADQLWPSRSHASDGTIGDASHAARSSKHNPANGLVLAADLTNDPQHGCDTWKIGKNLARSGDPRISAMGYHDPAKPMWWTLAKGWHESPLHGAPNYHLHIEFYPPPISDTLTPFQLTGPPAPTPPAPPPSSTTLEEPTMLIVNDGRPHDATHQPVVHILHATKLLARNSKPWDASSRVVNTPDGQAFDLQRPAFSVAASADGRAIVVLFEDGDTGMVDLAGNVTVH